MGSKVGWVAQPVRVAYALTSGGGWSKLNPNFLAVILIYSLMVSDVEEKTYEFGMLRMLGLEKQSLIFLMISEGLLFGMLGLSIGILFAYLLNTLVGYLFFISSEIMSSYDLDGSALALGISLGLLIPLISNYLPIRRALSKTLRDSLDMYHRAVNGVVITVMKLEKMGISPG